MFKKTLYLLLSASFILSACATPATPQAMSQQPATAMMEKPTQAMAEKPIGAVAEKPTQAMAEKPVEAMMNQPTRAAVVPAAAGEAMPPAPAWFDAALTNVHTGDNFTINDFKGKVVLVESLAIWCSNCMEQQQQVMALHETLADNPDLISIGLDVDPNETPADLKDYVENNGFDWVYAVAPAEVARDLGNLYGAQFLNPAAVPMLIIDRQGQVHPLPFGVKSAEDLLQFIQPFLNQDM